MRGPFGNLESDDCEETEPSFWKGKRKKSWEPRLHRCFREALSDAGLALVANFTDQA